MRQNLDVRWNFSQVRVPRFCRLHDMSKNEKRVVGWKHRRSPGSDILSSPATPPAELPLVKQFKTSMDRPIPEHSSVRQANEIEYCTRRART